MRKIILLLFLMPLLIMAQDSTYVPDDNFEQALIDLGYDTGVPNDSVLTATISAIDILTITSKSISDLTGIEAFSALTVLYCDSNNLDTLIFDSNTSLDTLLCNNNNLDTLGISTNASLTYLNCGNNNLNNLDVSACVSLAYLFCKRPIF